MVDARRAGARGATPSRPDAEFIESVKSLAKDERNTVFLLSSQETSMVQVRLLSLVWCAPTSHTLDLPFMLGYLTSTRCRSGSRRISGTSIGPIWV